MNYQLEKQMKGLSLQEVTRENWRDTLSLNVFPEQQRFIADYVPIAAIALAKAYIRPGGLVWVPYAFYANAEMVGAFIDNKDEPLSTMAVLISREAAEEYIKGDPFVIKGMVSNWYIREWANIF